MNAILNLVKKSDVTLIYLLNRIHSAILDKVMKCVTFLGSSIFSIVLPIVLFLHPHNKIKLMGIEIIFSLFISQLFVQSIKRIVNRPRPYIALKNIMPINPPQCKYSFPSGHTCTAFVIAFTLSKYMPPYSFVFMVLAVMVGISRIYLGVHYPTDVVIGSIIAYLTLKFTSILYFLL